jgi:hypothetical protein
MIPYPSFMSCEKTYRPQHTNKHVISKINNQISHRGLTELIPNFRLPSRTCIAFHILRQESYPLQARKGSSCKLVWNDNFRHGKKKINLSSKSNQPYCSANQARPASSRLEASTLEIRAQPPHYLASKLPYLTIASTSTIPLHIKPLLRCLLRTCTPHPES